MSGPIPPTLLDIVKSRYPDVKTWESFYFEVDNGFIMQWGDFFHPNAKQILQLSSLKYEWFDNGYVPTVIVYANKAQKKLLEAVFGTLPHYDNRRQWK